MEQIFDTLINLLPSEKREFLRECLQYESAIESGNRSVHPLDDIWDQICERRDQYCRWDWLFAQIYNTITIIKGKAAWNRYNITIPFHCFDFETQCQVFQAYYRHREEGAPRSYDHRHRDEEDAPLIFALLLDYESNSRRRIILASPENKRYQLALLNASEGFSSLDLYEQYKVVFQNETICDFLRSIGCLETTVLDVPIRYCYEISCSNDAQVREFCDIAMTYSQMGMQLRYNMEDATFTIQWLKKTSPFSESLQICENQVRLRMNRYFKELPEMLRNALKNDDVASFMMHLDLSNKKVCYCLLRIAAKIGSLNIMKELIDKYPDQCMEIIKGKEITQLLFEYCESTQDIIDILTLLENRQPGIIKNTIDEKGYNLLWWGLSHTMKGDIKGKLNKIEEFLLSCGCDAGNRFNGVRYQHFRDLLRKYKIGE